MRFFLVLQLLTFGAFASANLRGKANLPGSLQPREKRPRQLMPKCTQAQKNQGVGGCGSGGGDNTGTTEKSAPTSASGSTSASADDSKPNKPAGNDEADHKMVAKPVYHKNHGTNLHVDDLDNVRIQEQERKRNNKVNTRKERKPYKNFKVNKRTKNQYFKNRLGQYLGGLNENGKKKLKKKRKEKDNYVGLQDRPYPKPQTFKNSDDERKWTDHNLYRQKHFKNKRNHYYQVDADKRAEDRIYEDKEFELEDQVKDDSLSNKKRQQAKTDLAKLKAEKDKKLEVLSWLDTMLIPRLIDDFDTEIRHKTQEKVKDKLYKLDVPGMASLEQQSTEWKEHLKEKHEKVERKRSTRGT